MRKGGEGAMTESIGDILSVAFGLWFALFHKTLGERAAKYQQKFWRADFGEKTIRGIQISFLMVGLFFILFGLLSLFKIL